MNATLQTLFQYITDPCDLADSVSSFIQSRSEKLLPTVEALSEVIDGSMSPSVFENLPDIYHKWNLSLFSNGEGRYLNLDELACFIADSIDDYDGDPLVEVFDFTGNIAERIPLSEALDRIHSLLAESEMLTTALNIAQQVADGDTEDFLLTSFAKIEGYLQTSDLALKLKGIFTSVYEEIRENVQEPAYLVESILVHFGLAGDNEDPRKNDASEYTGQSTMCVLFMDAANKLGWAIAQLPTAWQFVVGWNALLIDTIRKIFVGVYKGIVKTTEKVIAKAFELDDAIQKPKIPGRGFIKHPGFSVAFDDQHTSFPTGQQFADIYNAIETAIGDTANQHHQYTVPVGPLVAYLDWDGSKAHLTYDMRPVDFKLYMQVYNNHFNAFPYLSVKSVGGSIHVDNTGETLIGKTRNQLIDFITDLYSHDHIWNMDYTFDSDKYMCVQASRHLLTIIYALVDTSWATIDSTLASTCSDIIYIDITKEYGYRSDTQVFIPENYNFASLCTEMGKRNFRVDCFYTYLDDDNELDFTNNSIIAQVQSISCDFLVMIGNLIAQVIAIDPLAQTNFFVPYFHKFKLYRPSYIISTDSDDLANVKRMIVTGLVVVAVVVVVVACVYLGAKFRKKKWIMEQQAAQKAFTASETGNAALMNEGYKLQKRLNLLGLLSGSTDVVSTPVTNGVTTAIKSLRGNTPSTATSEPSLKEIRELIKPY